MTRQEVIDIFNDILSDDITKLSDYDRADIEMGVEILETSTDSHLVSKAKCHAKFMQIITGG